MKNNVASGVGSPSGLTAFALMELVVVMASLPIWQVAIAATDPGQNRLAFALFAE